MCVIMHVSRKCKRRAPQYTTTRTCHDEGYTVWCHDTRMTWSHDTRMTCTRHALNQYAYTYIRCTCTYICILYTQSICKRCIYLLYAYMYTYIIYVCIHIDWVRGRCIYLIYASYILNQTHPTNIYTHI